MQKSQSKIFVSVDDKGSTCTFCAFRTSPFFLFVFLSFWQTHTLSLSLSNTHTHTHTHTHTQTQTQTQTQTHTLTLSLSVSFSLCPLFVYFLSFCMPVFIFSDSLSHTHSLCLFCLSIDFFSFLLSSYVIFHFPCIFSSQLYIEQYSIKISPIIKE